MRILTEKEIVSMSGGMSWFNVLEGAIFGAIGGGLVGGPIGIFYGAYNGAALAIAAKGGYELTEL
jgi:hypothetical protein